MTGSWLATTVLALYYLVLGVLSLYGMHRMVLVVLYLRGRRRVAAAPAASPTAALPRVTVQLPLYNEMYVAQRLIEAVCRLDYPRELLEVQVLDDSTDETTSVVADTVARLRGLGFAIEHLHRGERTGFKAGALAAGAERARGELIAVFDADFVPDPDFLRRAVPWFADPRIGMVQGRWEHLNRDYSLLTRVQAILLDGHFVVEHTARHASGCFFNFNGTAGVWRREVIAAAGGWQHDTLTEDLDLSYRAQLAGWRFVYLPELTVPSELPVDVNGFKSQQFRWAKGSIQTARKLLGRILAAPLPLRVKGEAFIHLTNNVSYVLMVALSLLLPAAMLIRRGQPVATLLAVDLPLFAAATASVVVFYVASQAGAGRRWWRDLVYVPALMAVGIGLSVSNARAVVSGWRHRGGTFERTPKYRIERRGEDWLGKRYRAGRSAAVLGEGLLTAYLAAAFLHAAWTGLWASLPFLYLFLQGYLFVFLLSVVPGRAGRSRAPRVQPARLP
ncbi:MAG TPA: cellulose synthase family protein [Thermoanaerobaculia bacterium]|nr:cellulose synthase family protein [Thermoanaerobaculia bacterium]